MTRTSCIQVYLMPNSEALSVMQFCPVSPCSKLWFPRFSEGDGGACLEPWCDSDMKTALAGDRHSVNGGFLYYPWLLSL